MMQLFVPDIVSDTAGLTNEEVGAYNRILWFAWQQKCRPLTTKEIATASRLSVRAFEKTLRAALAPYFDAEQIAAGLWVQRRLADGYASAVQRAEAARVNGKRGGRPRKKPSGFSTETQPLTQPKANQNQSISEEAKASSPSVAAQRGTRIPEEFSRGPPDGWFGEVDALLRSRGIVVDLDLEWRKFVNYWRSKSRDAARKDWYATWENWCLNAEKYCAEGRHNGHGRQQSLTYSEAGAALDDARARRGIH